MSPRTVLFISTLCFLAAFSLAELQSLGKIQSKWKQLLRKRRESGVRNEDDLTPYFDTFLKKPSSLKSHLTERNSRDDVSQLPRTCGKVQAFFEPQSNTIIKTKESMQNGAKFIASPSVHTYDECNKHCCEEPSCSLSVYDGKTLESVGMSSCYLFDCSKPDSCQFTEHSNYTSTSITRLPPEAPPGDARENELEDLKQMIPGLVPGRDEDFIQTTKTTTTTTRATTTTTTTAPPTTTTRRTTPRPTRYVTLLERCEFHADCADENAVCDNVCICKAGMKPSYGKCAPVQQSAACSHLQFACQSRPHDSYTHCIASYDKCDGIAQCPLGDDEVGCQGGPDDVSSGGRSHIQRRPGVDHLRPPTTQAPPGGEIRNHPGSQMAPLTTPEEEGRKDEPSTEVQSSETHEDTDPATEDSQPASKPDESPSEKPDSTELEKQETHEPDQPASKPSPEPTSKPPSKPTSPPELPKPPSRSKPRVTMGDADHIIVSKIEIERHNADSTFLTYDGDLQGAIVALTLGLTITVVLLVFVVCKLRSVKRRLRRGRLASNDADYLINGMYL